MAMKQDSDQQITSDDFDRIYHNTLMTLAERETLHSEVSRHAQALVADLPSEVKQHYHPRHMAAASLHIASRVRDNPRTVKQLAVHLKELDGLHKHRGHLTKTRRCVKKLKNLHELDPDPVLAEDYLPQLIEKLGVSSELEERCYRILNRIREDYLASGRSQIAVASAAALIASKKIDSIDSLDLGELADVACREKETIQDNAALFRRKLGLTEESSA